MSISKEEVIQTTVDLLSIRIKDRLEFVECLPGNSYIPTSLDLKANWIIRVKPEETQLDGREQYIIVDKKTGITRDVNGL